MNNITLTPLTGSEKQNRWAESIRKKVLAFVLENKEAIAEQIRKNEEDMPAHIQRSTFDELVERIAKASRSKVWIEKYRDGVKTIEEAARLLSPSAFSLPTYVRRGEDVRDWYCRMEAAKERMRDGFCC